MPNPLILEYDELKKSAKDNIVIGNQDSNTAYVTTTNVWNA